MMTEKKMLSGAPAISGWIESLGKNLSCLIEASLIEDEPPKCLYENTSTYEIEPIEGVELVFDSKSNTLVAIYIVLTAQPGSTQSIYRGELPEPYGNLTQKSKVRCILGNPYKSEPPFSIYLPELFEMGGIDFYEVEEHASCNTTTEFHYTTHLTIAVVVFRISDW
jgi:hypothetical protein